MDINKNNFWNSSYDIYYSKEQHQWVLTEQSLIGLINAKTGLLPRYKVNSKCFN